MSSPKKTSSKSSFFINKLSPMKKTAKKKSSSSKLSLVKKVNSKMNKYPVKNPSKTNNLDSIYDCLLCDIELTILKKKKEISKRLKELSTANDPRSRAIFDNLELQLALYLCFEPTIEDLIARPMSISNATLHEFILMRLKQVTLIFSKSLKKKKTGKKPLG